MGDGNRMSKDLDIASTNCKDCNLKKKLNQKIEKATGHKMKRKFANICGKCFDKNPELYYE